MRLDGFLSASAERAPDTKAVTFPGCTLTYARLHAWVNSLAQAFSALGVARGDAVSILLANSPDFLATYLAVVRLGAVAVPLNTFLTAEELRALVTDSRSRLLVTSAAFADTAAPLADCVPSVLDIDSGDGRYVPCREAPETAAAPEAAPDADDNEPATYIYTSGTTGTPKGVVLTHGNLTSNVESCRKAFPVGPDDRFLVFLPLFHSFTLTVSTLLPLSAGARIVLCASARPFGRLVKRIATERVSVIAAVPAFYKALARTKIPGLSIVMRSLRFCISGSAPLPGTVLEAFEKRFRAPLLEGYGLSEAAPVVSVNPFDGVRKPGSAGLPLPGVEVRIVGETGEACAAGDVGEVTVKGPNVMEGYLRMPEETAAAVSDGWLRTGDMGRLDDDGYLFIVDRKKDLILHRGMNVYPREIEEVLLKHPAIAEAAVIGTPHPNHGEVPTAYVILNDGASVTADDVKEACSSQLAAYKVPKAVHFVKDVPRTATGKIHKRKLAETCVS
jgi:long-chain acyl-CoA synthetase